MNLSRSLIAAAALSIGALAFSLAPAHAEGKPGALGAGGPGGGPGARSGMKRASPEDILQRISSKLELTADQQKKALPLVKDMMTKMDAEFGKGAPADGDREKRMAKMKSIGDDFKKKLGAILTDAQRKKFDELNQQRRPAGASGPGAPGGPGKPNGKG